MNTLRTERLLLRLPRLSDAEAIFKTYAADKDVTRYLTWTPHQSSDDTRDFLRFKIAEIKTGVTLNWVILRAGDGTLMGNIEARILKPWMIEIGYVLGRDYWGEGYMTETLAAVITNLFQKRHKIERVQAFCDCENPGSARVMEKCGMQQEGFLRRFGIHPNVSDKPRDVYLYSIIREEHTLQKNGF